ncbi:MAG: Protein of unknown function (DUF1302) [Candidatus Methanocomedens sp.]|nr:MAG: Protein of unknown function (DUF1302) [ANME-2 cluster archaeon]
MRVFFITILFVCIILFFASTAPCVDEIIIITEPTIEETPQEFKQKKLKSLKDNLSIRGFIQTKGAVDTNNDAANEHDYTFYNNARIEGKWTFEGSRNYIFASIDSEYLWFGPHNNEEDYDLDLFEGYFYWSNKRIVRPRFRTTPIQYGIKRYFSWLRGPVDIRVGRQIVRWGKTDQISPVDNLNPQDLREFITHDLEDRKIPNWMVRARLFSDFFTVEGIYLPFFESSRIDYFGTDWAIFRHMNRIGVHEEEPDRKFKNGEGGVRVTKTISGWDLGLSYLYAWEDLPYFETFPTGGGDVQITYKRSNIFGFEFETTAGEIGLRGEAAYFDQQSFLTNNLTSTRKIVYYYIVGVDYSGENDWYINIQFSHQIITNYDSTILYFKRNNPSLCGEISKEFQEGYFEAELKYNFALNENSFYLSPRIICSYASNLDITLGLNIFEGDSDTLMGLYDANDQIYIDFKYYF